MPADIAPPPGSSDEVPSIVLVGLFPKSLRRGADCLVYSDRFVFLGLSRKAVLKRLAGTPTMTLDPAGIPMALIMTAASKVAEKKIQPLGKDIADRYQLSPELAEALEHAKTIKFVDIARVSFPWYVFGRPYAVDLQMVDGSRERLLPGQTYAKKPLVQQTMRQVLGDKISSGK